jgi:hypothetical protein
MCYYTNMKDYAETGKRMWRSRGRYNAAPPGYYVAETIGGRSGRLYRRNGEGKVAKCGRGWDEVLTESCMFGRIVVRREERTRRDRMSVASRNWERNRRGRVSGDDHPS